MIALNKTDLRPAGTHVMVTHTHTEAAALLDEQQRPFVAYFCGCSDGRMICLTGLHGFCVKKRNFGEVKSKHASVCLKSTLRHIPAGPPLSALSAFLHRWSVSLTQGPNILLGND